jgi:hypothetical protein
MKKVVKKLQQGESGEGGSGENVRQQQEGRKGAALEKRRPGRMAPGRDGKS